MKRRRLFKLLLAGIVIAILFAGLEAIDWTIGYRYTPKAGLDMDSPHPTMRTLDWYPYEGWHLQAYAVHQGPMWWESTTWGKPTRVRAGQMGYFIDFDLDRPPPKQTNEFRIILIGGSGAQGWVLKHAVHFQVHRAPEIPRNRGAMRRPLFAARQQHYLRT